MAREGGGLRPGAGGARGRGMSLDEKLRKELDDLVAAHKVVLFMKGNRRMPQCGFSSTVVGILDELIPSYETVNVLARPEVRDGIKEYSSWPTIPQLYVDGKFVGGCDIVREMHATGDLAKTLGVTVAEPVKPTITVSAEAAKALLEARESDADVLRLEVGPKYQYGLSFGPRNAGDVEVSAAGLTLVLDRASARRADGISIEFVTGPEGGGFKITSPHEPVKVKQLTPEGLKALMDKGEKIELFDVRTPREREVAVIAGARHLDEEGRKYLETLDRNAKVVFHCHHGGRSQAAAEHYVAQGFKDVSNLSGGIDSWSRTVDPKIARY